jgi:hypothetical protein
MATTLQSLRHGASALAASEGFRAGLEMADFSPYETLVVAPDNVDMSAVDSVLTYAMKNFDSNREMSDAWVAPRLHAALRISRRTAADGGIWRWMAMVHAPEFVRWRWGRNDKVPGLNRFDGDDKKQTFARLWWTAELCRDGSDYSPAERAFKYQDFVNSCVCATEFAHHRPAVQATLQAVLADDGRYPPGELARALPKALNIAAGTRLLDALGPELEERDVSARHTWRGELHLYDPRAYLDELPLGPDEEPVPPQSVASIRSLIDGILADPSFATLINQIKGRRSRGDSPSETIGDDE